MNIWSLNSNKKQEYKEWLQEKKEIMAESDVEFIHVIEYDRVYTEFENEHGVFVEDSVKEILTKTVHVEDLPDPIITKMVQNGDVEVYGDNSYAYVPDRDFELKDWMTYDLHEIANEYKGDINYDYPTEFVTNHI